MYLLQCTGITAYQLPDKSRPLPFQPTQMGSHFIRPLCMWPAADHDLYDQCISTHKFGGGLQSLHEAGDDVMHWLKFTAATALAR